MADHRKPLHTFLLTTGRKTALKIEVFCASEWAHKGGEKGLYRLRIDGKWLVVGDMKYTFYAYDGLCLELGERLGVILGERTPAYKYPDIPRGTRVRAPNGKTLDGVRLTDLTRTTTPPVMCWDGKWRVGIVTYRDGFVFHEVDTIEVLK